MSDKHIVIVGGLGSVGSFLTFSFAQNTNFPLSVICRGKSKESFDANGFKIFFREQEKEKCFSVSQNRFYYVGDLDGFHEKIMQDKINNNLVIIISIKQYDMTTKLAEKIAQLLHLKLAKKTSQPSLNQIIAIISNGIPFCFLQNLNLNLSQNFISCTDPQEKIAKICGFNHIYGIQPIVASSLEQGGHAHILRPLSEITIAIGFYGNYNFINAAIKKNLLDLLRLFTAARIKTSLAPLHKNILEKLQFTLSINMFSAIMNEPNGYIFDASKFQIIIFYIITIVNAIGRALGLDELRNYIGFKSLLITRSHYSSLCKDKVAGNRHEGGLYIDATCALINILQKSFPCCNHLFPSLEPLEKIKPLLDEASVKEKEILELFRLCGQSLITFCGAVTKFKQQNSYYNRIVSAFENFNFKNTTAELNKSLYLGRCTWLYDLLIITSNGNKLNVKLLKDCRDRPYPARASINPNGNNKPLTLLFSPPSRERQLPLPSSTQDLQRLGSYLSWISFAS